MKPIFCGNFEFDARQGDLERLFRKYGKVDRVDMKSGFAFVYMEDERDAEDAIRALDRYEFGRKGRQLRVEWTKQERTVRQPVSSRKSSSNSRPSKTLFVINFDPYNTRTKDLEKHFDPYGKIMNIRIRRNFAFIQFELQEEATKALESTNMSKLMDRVISVEYAVKNDDDRKTRNSPGGRDRSPRRRIDDRGRSPSPYRRERGSPDYGRGRDWTSPDNGRRRGRSPSPNRRDRVSPAYGRGSSPAANGKGKARNADYRRDASLSPHRRDRDRVSPDNGRGSSPGANGKGRVRNADYSRDTSPSPRRGRGRSPRESIPKEKASPSPRRGRERSPRESIPKEKASPEYEQGAILSPQSEGRVSPNDYPRAPSPDPKPDIRDSPGYNRAESPPERYRSRSPSARDRSRS